MKVLLKITVLLSIIFSGLYCYAQDFHLSQYDASPLNTNPSLTGMFQGKQRFHLHYRTQWSAVSTNPFTTIQAAWDMRINNSWAVGVEAMNYNAGSANYNATILLPSVSYSFPLSANRYHRLTLGLSAGIFSNSMQFKNLTWGNQFEMTSTGGHFNTGINSGESLSDKIIFRPDFNFGAVYFYSQPDAKINPFVGFTLFHLSQPNISLLGRKTKLSMRYLVHGGVRILVNERIDLLPKIYWQMQAKAQEITLSTELDYYFPKPSIYLIAALTYRANDAIIAEIGGKLYGWALRLSYDFNTSHLTPYSHYRGATELSISYIIQPKIKKNTLLTCPRL